MKACYYNHCCQPALNKHISVPNSISSAACAVGYVQAISYTAFKPRRTYHDPRKPFQVAISYTSVHTIHNLVPSIPNLDFRQ
jgi:hypothetical protein